MTGTLLLVGSLAAARFGDRPRAEDYLRDAGIAARRLGRDANFAWTAFGPRNVSIHAVNTAAELGDMDGIVESCLPDNLSAMPTERRVRYHLDFARALTATGRHREAEEKLLSIEREAPEHVRRHHISRKIVSELITATSGKPSSGLDSLARRMQLFELSR